MGIQRKNNYFALESAAQIARRKILNFFLGICGISLFVCLIFISTFYPSRYSQPHGFFQEDFNLKSSSSHREDSQSSEETNTSISAEEISLESLENTRSLPKPPFIIRKAESDHLVYDNSPCAPFPTINNIEYSNSYWQTLITSNGTLHLYGAYYDIRKGNNLSPSVRILGMMDRIKPTVTTYCQLWFANEQHPEFSRVIEYNYIWIPEWGNNHQEKLQPYLLTCQVPGYLHGKVPTSISIVERPCDAAKNKLRVQFDRPEVKKIFGVCVKGLDLLNEDLSIRLVEWIELLLLLGANKIYFYEFAVHPNISKVLEYYVSTGQVEVTPLTLPGDQPNDPQLRHTYLTENKKDKRKNELIPYNDCFYRNLYKYEYIALLDIDEIIIPKQAANWSELLNEIVRNSDAASKDAYYFRNVYFMDDMMHSHDWFSGVPKHLHMLQHVYRSVNHTKKDDFAKCFHSTETVLTLHNHFPISCLNEACKSFPVSKELAQLQHYRTTCVAELKNCYEQYVANSVLDTAIWRYKEPLVDRTTRVLSELGVIAKFE